MDKCLQARKIMPLIDRDNYGESDEKFRNHISTCRDCKKKLDSSKRILNIISRNIPSRKIEKSVHESFKSEIREIFLEVGYRKTKYSFLTNFFISLKKRLRI